MTNVRKKGFTLVEVMIVVAIIGLLAALGMPSFQKSRKATCEMQVKNTMRLLRDGADRVLLDGGITSSVPNAVVFSDIYNAGYIKVSGATGVNDLVPSGVASVMKPFLATAAFTGTSWGLATVNASAGFEYNGKRYSIDFPCGKSL